MFWIYTTEIKSFRYQIDYLASSQEIETNIYITSNRLWKNRTIFLYNYSYYQLIIMCKVWPRTNVITSFSPWSTFISNTNANLTHSHTHCDENGGSLVRRRRQLGSFITDGADSHALLPSLPRELQEIRLPNEGAPSETG